MTQTTTAARHLHGPSVHRQGLLLMVLAGVLWGTQGPSGRFVQDHMAASPLDLAVYRAALATVGLSAVVRAWPRIETRRDWLLAGVVGFTISAIQVMYFAAIELSSVTVATLVTFGLGPVFVAVGETFISRRAPRRGVLIAMATSVVGLALLVGGGEPSAGAAVAALGAVLYAISVLVSRSMTNRVRNADLNLAVSAVATVLLLPAVAVSGLELPENTAAAAGVLYLGISAIVAFALTLAALRRVTATESSIIGLLEPLTAALLAAMLFSERLGPIAVLGAVLMLGSVAALFRRTEVTVH